VKSKWLHQKKSNKLIFFCNGWGMDEHPLTPLESHEWNVLMFYDYTDLTLDQDLHKLVDEYQEIVLIAWSMGVWVGQQLFYPFLRDLTASLAINGTLCPIDDQFGIPEDVVRATLANLDENQRLKFYLRMCRERVLYRNFLDNQPQRSVESQRKELAVLLEIARCHSSEKSIYEYVLVSEQDRIMPTKNQLSCWPDKIVRRVDGSHFLFYAYGSWDEIVYGMAV
jgi:pimeloyl-[acyl-carrier protein] methyl ester esterase